MKSAIVALLTALPLLTGCIGLKSGGEGVFDPTAVQPPPSERGAGASASPAATTPAATDRRGLSVPSR